jgi:riboflavin synthase
MFTGLIEATGQATLGAPAHGGRGLRVETPLAVELTPGDSIAVNGVCLTVTARDARHFEADVSPETLAVTSLGAAAGGRVVNLERPVRADARMGGHFVLGHVDATGTIRDLREDEAFHWLEVDVPASIASLVVPKGSIAIDGISLTVARITGGVIGVQIVPFTFAHTSLQEARAGDLVNLEADVLGKYVARLIDLSRDTVDRAIVRS